MTDAPQANGLTTPTATTGYPAPKFGQLQKNLQNPSPPSLEAL